MSLGRSAGTAGQSRQTSWGRALNLSPRGGHKEMDAITPTCAWVLVWGKCCSYTIHYTVLVPGFWFGENVALIQYIIQFLCLGFCLGKMLLLYNTLYSSCAWVFVWGKCCSYTIHYTVLVPGFWFGENVALIQCIIQFLCLGFGLGKMLLLYNTLYSSCAWVFVWGKCCSYTIHYTVLVPGFLFGENVALIQYIIQFLCLGFGLGKMLLLYNTLYSSCAWVFVWGKCCSYTIHYTVLVPGFLFGENVALIQYIIQFLCLGLVWGKCCSYTIHYTVLVPGFWFGENVALIQYIIQFLCLGFGLGKMLLLYNTLYSSCAWVLVWGKCCSYTIHYTVLVPGFWFGENVALIQYIIQFLCLGFGLGKMLLLYNTLYSSCAWVLVWGKCCSYTIHYTVLVPGFWFGENVALIQYIIQFLCLGFGLGKMLLLYNTLYSSCAWVLVWGKCCSYTIHYTVLVPGFWFGENVALIQYIIQFLCLGFGLGKMLLLYNTLYSSCAWVFVWGKCCSYTIHYTVLVPGFLFGENVALIQYIIQFLCLGFGLGKMLLLYNTLYSSCAWVLVWGKCCSYTIHYTVLVPGFLFGENVALIQYIIQFLCLGFCLGKMLLLYNTLYSSCAWVLVWGKCCSYTIHYTVLVPGFLFGENVALIQYIIQFLCLGFGLGKMLLLFNTLYSSCAWVLVWGKCCSYTIHYTVLVPGFWFGENVALIQYIIQFLCLGFGLGKMLLLYNTLYSSCAWVFVWGKCCSYTIHYTVLVPGFWFGENVALIQYIIQFLCLGFGLGKMLLLYNTLYSSCAWVFVWGKCCSYTIHYTVLVPGFLFGENVALIQYIIQFLCLGFGLGKMLLLYNTLYSSCAWVFVWGKCCSYTIHYTVLVPGLWFGENVALIQYIIQFLCLGFCLGKMLLLYNTLYSSCAWVLVWGKCCSYTIHYTVLVPGFLFGENVALIQYIIQFLCLGFGLGKMLLLYNTLYSSCAWVFVWGKCCSYTIHYTVLVPGFWFGENVALIQYIIQFLCLGFCLGKMLLLYNTLYNSCAWVFVWGKCCSYTIHYTVLVPGFWFGEMLLLYNTLYSSCAWVFVWGKCCSYTIHYTVLVPGFLFGENVALIQYIIQFLCLGFGLGKMLLLYNTLYSSCAWVFVWGKCCSYTIHYTVLVPGFLFGENVALIQYIIQFLCLGFGLGKMLLLYNTLYSSCAWVFVWGKCCSYTIHYTVLVPGFLFGENVALIQYIIQFLCLGFCLGKMFLLYNTLYSSCAWVFVWGKCCSYTIHYTVLVPGFLFGENVALIQYIILFLCLGFCLGKMLLLYNTFYNSCAWVFVWGKCCSYTIHYTVLVPGFLFGENVALIQYIILFLCLGFCLGKMLLLYNTLYSSCAWVFVWGKCCSYTTHCTVLVPGFLSGEMLLLYSSCAWVFVCGKCRSYTIHYTVLVPGFLFGENVALIQYSIQFLCLGFCLGEMLLLYNTLYSSCAWVFVWGKCCSYTIHYTVLVPGFWFGENVALIQYIIQFLCLGFCLGKMLLLYNTLYNSCAWVFVWGKCCSYTIHYTVLVPGFLFGENVALIQHIIQFLCLGFCLGKM